MTDSTLPPHGGDLRRLGREAACDPALVLDFSANIRPEGPPPFMVAAMTRALNAVQAYPSPHGEEACEAAARYHGCPQDCFVFGNGSNELFSALARVLVRRGCRQALIMDPAFSEYDRACRRAGLRTLSWQGMAERGFAPDLERLVREAPTGVSIWLANPGNPAGGLIEPQALRRARAARPDLVWILDEAFIDYSGEAFSLLHDATQAEGTLVVVRSLTKFYAVPGLRVGYAACEAGLAAAVREEIPNWNLNAFALAAACAALEGDPAVAEAIRRDNAERREHLSGLLRELGLDVLPSAGNYVLFRWPQQEPLRLRLLREHQIAVRDCATYPGLAGGGWFRVAVRLPEDHDCLAQALRALRSGEAPVGGTAVSAATTMPEAATTTTGHATPNASAMLSENPLNPLSPNLPDAADRAANDSTPNVASPGAGSPDIFRPKVPQPDADSPDVLQPATSQPDPVRPDVPQKDQPAARAGRVRGRTGQRPALMVQGTSSNAGKSIIAAALCRILRQDGYDVAPFKAQNMSLNSGVTALGLEMGRAQILQAKACRIAPDARMNPVLLKPQSETGSQVVVLGKVRGHLAARDYARQRGELWKDVTQAYAELSAEHEVMVLEGAGSPAEINLKDADLVNMVMARHAKASVLLVGDIDRGGVYASFMGTWLTFTPAERALLAGFLVNRFRGDASLLDPAHVLLHAHTGVPVLGVVPYLHDLRLPDEDGYTRQVREEGRQAEGNGHRQRNGTPLSASDPDRPLEVVVIVLGHVANLTDVDPLCLEPGVHLRTVKDVADWGAPDLVILPGSKGVAADMESLRQRGLADKVLAHARNGGWIFGICGGLQMLGARIDDPLGVESSQTSCPGLGLLDIWTTFAAPKILLRVEEAQTPLGVTTTGYEIHHGRTEHGPGVEPLFRRVRQRGDINDCIECSPEEANICGYVAGRCWSTYLHGVFDNDRFRRVFVDHVREDCGLSRQSGPLTCYDMDAALDTLAAVVRESVDLAAIYRHMGLA